MRKFFLQANDQQDLVDWVNALNNATKITVRHTHIEDQESIPDWGVLKLVFFGSWFITWINSYFFLFCINGWVDCWATRLQWVRAWLTGCRIVVMSAGIKDRFHCSPWNFNHPERKMILKLLVNFYMHANYRLYFNWNKQNDPFFLFTSRSLTCVCVFFLKVPKLSDGQQNAENQKTLPDVVGPKKQVSYRTEIIGGVPIVTQTQVNNSFTAPHAVLTCTQARCHFFDYYMPSLMKTSLMCIVLINPSFTLS